MYHTLTHHGILGQKWGKRNGPPYPLDESDHSAAEKKAAKESSGKKTDGGEKTERKGLTDGQKRAIKIGAAAVGVALLAYGGYKLHQSGALDNFINVEKNNSNMDNPTYGFKKIRGKENEASRLSKCNPNATLADMQSPFATPYNRNCGNTTIANELRARGLDVQARGNMDGMYISEMGQFFTGLKSDSFCTPKIEVPNLSTQAVSDFYTGTSSKSTLEEVRSRATQVKQQIEQQMLSQYPEEGARGSMMFTGMGMSHWISWENKGGKIEFTNPQDPSRDLTSMFGTYVYHANDMAASTTALRLDNLGINGDTIKSAVTSFGDTSQDARKSSFNFYRKDENNKFPINL